MENKSQIPKIKLPQSTPNLKPSPSPDPKSSRPPVWDCGSTLYDSFELTSFQRHLDSAITATSARSFSMPHRVFPAPSVSSSAPSAPRSKLSRSFRKLIRSVFPNSKSKAQKYGVDSGRERSQSVEIEKARWFVVYEDEDGVGFEKDRKEKGVALSTIEETPEVEKKAGVMSPEIGPAVRKTMSERFTAASVRNRTNLISLLKIE